MYFQFHVAENFPLLHTISIRVTVGQGVHFSLSEHAPLARGLDAASYRGRCFRARFMQPSESGGPAHRHLELNLEQVKQIHGGTVTVPARCWRTHAPKNINSTAANEYGKEYRIKLGL
jgi:hypothetical protein